MTDEVKHLRREELEAGLDEIRRSPAGNGRLELIVRRPDLDAREIVNEGVLDPETGLVGDSWHRRANSHAPGRKPDPNTQLNVMNSRVIALIAPDRRRWPLAGDQLFVDFDLSEANVPAGTRLAIGSSVIEVTAEPHTGCGKFVSRFGVDAMKFVNSPVGRELHLRGINARVVQPGTIRTGDAVTKVST